KHRTVLHAIFVRARGVKAWGVTENPLDSVDAIAAAERSPIEIYSADEIAALLRAAETPEDAALFLTATGAGLRRGELVALRVRDVDFAARKIRVEHSYSFDK